MYQSQAVTNNNVIPSMNPKQHQNINYNEVKQQHGPQQPQQHASRGYGKKPCVKIIEQPAGKALRFRYECEGRSAGSIPGVNSTPENKTYPTIEIVGYKGRAVVVVSCVTKDPPYRPHPHNLVGKEGCKKGVCTIEINNETMRAVFSNLGIQCVKKKDIDGALKAREDIRVDPFKTGFGHRRQPSSIDLNSVRLCFQVFLESEQGGRFTVPLTPVISEPIFDKKAMSDLVICRLCSCSATVLGNTQIILLCEKVAKDDIMVRFFEEKDGKTWEAYGDFQQTDVHKQTAITFKTPRYYKLDITEPAKVFIQLKRPSDGVTSEPLPFEYIPLDSDPNELRRKRRKTIDDTSLLLQQENNQRPLQQNRDHAVEKQTNMTQWNSFVPSIKIEPRDASQQSYMNYQPQQTMHQQQFQQQSFQQELFEESTNWTVGASNRTNDNIQTANNYLRHNPGGVSNHVHASNASNLNQTNPFVQPPWNAPQDNLREQQIFQQQHQYQQHHQPAASTNMPGVSNNLQNARQTRTVGTDGTGGNNAENGPTVSNLLTFDSGQLLPLNSQNQQNIQLDSEDLQISSLSISS